jgi:PIN domain nuclease of toxin-antitoxin system
MIVVDTHIWVWWVNNSRQLPKEHKMLLENSASDGIGVSVISCWEIAKLVELGRLTLSIKVDEWIETALAYPGVQLLALTPHIAVESTQLPGTFHRDPADQLIVATARIYDSPLMTVDERILAYLEVKHIFPASNS